jgi:nucleoside 2-deoxyribosyltransferase
MNLTKSIYLIGHINPAHPETYAWREEVEDYFTQMDKDGDISIINPCDSSFDARLMEQGKEDPERLAAYRKKGTRIFVPKSRQSVDESTIAIANLNTYGSEAPMIGTIMELAWYMDNPQKTVIGLLTEGNVSTDPYAAHPFVAESVHVWTKSVKEACRMVGMFFL